MRRSADRADHRAFSPYIYAFPARPFPQVAAEVFRQMTGAIPPPLQNRKRAWFTDTLEDVNGGNDRPESPPGRN